VLIVIAVATAYALLLLIPSLAAGHKWTQNAAVACIAVLALEIIAAICGEIDAEGYYRLVIVTSIVTVLMTLVVPICLKLRGKEDGEHFDRLVLHKVADDIYADQSGRRVRVTQIES
jgi:Na+/melibiose symporter-like transporter